MALSSKEILVVGIDPAKEKHSIVALSYPEKVLRSADIQNTPAAIARMDDRMRQLAQKENLMLVYATEDSSKYGDLLARMLRQRERTIHTVSPAKTSVYKKFYGDDKTDRVDARCVADITLRNPEKIILDKELMKRDDLVDALRSLTRYYDDLGDTKKRFINHLHEKLTQFWGYQYKLFFSRIDGKTACKFWKEYPSPGKVKGLSQKDLQDFIYEKSKKSISRRRAGEKARAILAVAGEFPDLYSEKVLKLKEKSLANLVDMMAIIAEQLKETKAQMKKLVGESGYKLDTFPGVKVVRAAKLIALVGNPHRFRNSGKFARYNGTAPREWSSGKRKKHYPSRQFNRKLKDQMMGIAVTAVRCDPVSREYFQRQIKRGKTKRQAYKLTARRISDILLSMMKHRTEYDGERHRKSPHKISNDGAGQKAPQPVA